ncbi:transferase [Arenibacter sp. TNZ]|jgi:sugar O-acyltransferase (sialic acid O-acetyltransferase NeuD family)|uniref:acetyltransferase n=1 Tax=Arenibacter TaxID=178469 RepID=UPI000CD47219|nr:MULTISPECIES: acetyltransferase [Arenibacter]MCM4174056.1 transferase [Arenibacter sp. TNZ]
MQNIVIFGASGHGSVVLDSLEREGKYNIIGFLDSFKKKGLKHNGYEILGNEHELPYLMERFNIIGGVVAIGDNWTRHLIVEKINKIVPGFNFVLAIHPNAIVGKDVEIGKGTVIMAGSIINANSRIGRHCIVNTNSSVGHDSIVEDFSSLASRACTGGNFILGEFSVVSLGVNVIENITILEHSVIGAGSLILEDIPGYVVAYGSPAKVIKNRRIGEVYLSGSKDHLVKIVAK